MEGEVDSSVVSIESIAVVALVLVSFVVATFTEIGIKANVWIAMLFYTAIAVLSFYLLLRLVVAVEKIVR